MPIFHDQMGDFMVDWIEDHLGGFTTGSVTAFNMGVNRYICHD